MFQTSSDDDKGAVSDDDDDDVVIVRKKTKGKNKRKKKSSIFESGIVTDIFLLILDFLMRPTQCTFSPFVRIVSVRTV